MCRIYEEVLLKEMKRLLYYISTALPLRFRMLFLKWSGVTVGKDAVLSRGFYIDRSNGLCLGQKVFVNYGVHFHCGADEKCRIEIQDKVFVGPDVKFCIPSHIIGKASQRAGANTYESICVKQGAWVCAASIILGGSQ